MTPILGIMASQNYVRTLPGSYESIATSTITSGSSNTVTFSSIPQTYKHLQIRSIARSSSGIWNYLLFNSDTTQANYYAHELAGNGSVAYSNAYPSGSNPIGIQLFVTYGYTDVFSEQVIDILDYTSTSKNKTVRCINGWDNNANGEIRLTSGLWSATPTAVTSLTLKCGSANAYQVNSTFALYGIKG